MPIELAELLKGNGYARGVTTSAGIAVVTMELQRGVMGDLASFPALAVAASATGVAEHAGQLSDAARECGISVVHCTASFRKDRAATVVNTPLHSAVLRSSSHLLEGTEAVELIAQLAGHPSDLIVDRHFGVSPFLGTELDATLRNIGARTLIVAGVSLNVGVFGLCVEAANLGYQIVIASDAVCGVPVEYGEQILAESLRLLAAIAPTDEVITTLRSITTTQPDIV